MKNNNKKRRKSVYDPTLSMTERISVRLTHYQAHELREICKREGCALTVLVRALIARFVEDYEVKRGQIPSHPADER